MPRYVAFLRAVNVGGRVVKMDRLKSIFEALSFKNVETFIASGNVLFDARATDTRALEKRIEKALERELGYEVLTFVRTPAEVAGAADCAWFADPDAIPRTELLYIGFLKTEPTGAVWEQLLSHPKRTGELGVRGHVMYWRLRRNLREYAVMAKLLERTLGPATMRSVTTVQRLSQKLEART